MSPEVIVVAIIVVALVVFFLFRKKQNENRIDADADAELEQLQPPPRAPLRPESAGPTKEPVQSTDAALPSRSKDGPGTSKAQPSPLAKPEAAKVASAPSAATQAKDTQVRSHIKDVAGLRKGLAKSRGTEGIFGRLKALFGGTRELDPSLAERIEEVLLTSDVGMKTTQALVQSVRDGLAKNELSDADKVWSTLRAKTVQLLGADTGGLPLSATPTVVMVIGVNGVGKTTTIGKLATRFTQQGKKVVLAAGDTFRAAAVQQLVVWGKRSGCEVVSGDEGANAGAVIFDAIQKAKSIGADIVLADTAGRLHTKVNLMEELKKIQRTMAKAQEGAPHQTLLVLDATNGQNAMQQVTLFQEALPLTGIVLTKLDGTAKGGIVLGVCAEHSVPVRYIGVGERAEDLREFDAEEFVEALLGSPGSDTDQAA